MQRPSFRNYTYNIEKTLDQNPKPGPENRKRKLVFERASRILPKP